MALPRKISDPTIPISSFFSSFRVVVWNPLPLRTESSFRILVDSVDVAGVMVRYGWYVSIYELIFLHIQVC